MFSLLRPLSELNGVMLRAGPGPGHSVPPTSYGSDLSLGHCRVYLTKESEDPQVSRALWLVPVIPATQEALIGRSTVQSWPEEMVCKTLSWEKGITKRSGVVA
jgi:hypothetical protein